MSQRFKGIRFPSWDTPLPEPKAKTQWVSHNGNRAKLRYLRQRCRSILDSTDPDVVMVGQRLAQAVRFEKDKERAALMLIHAGLLDSARTGVPWTVAADALLDNYEQYVEEKTAKQKVKITVKDEPDGETSGDLPQTSQGSGPLRGEVEGGHRGVDGEASPEGEPARVASGD